MVIGGGVASWAQPLPPVWSVWSAYRQVRARASRPEHFVPDLRGSAARRPGSRAPRSHVSDDCGLSLGPHRCDQRPAATSFVSANKEREKNINNYKGALRSMKLLGLDHVGIVVSDIDEAVARAGDTVDGRADDERFV